VHFAVNQRDSDPDHCKSNEEDTVRRKISFETRGFCPYNGQERYRKYYNISKNRDNPEFSDIDGFSAE
jgi:hypothetical protein